MTINLHVNTSVSLLVCLLIAGWFVGLSEAQANCSTVTCYNGGTCNNYTASPPCLCPLPYIAPYCSAAADYCFTLQPDKGISELPVCLNGGNCTLTYTDPYFNCSCPNGYTGIRCNETVSTSEPVVSETTSPPDSSVIGIVIGAVCGGVAVIAGVTTVAVLIKTGKIPFPSSSVEPDSNEKQPEPPSNQSDNEDRQSSNRSQSNLSSSSSSSSLARSQFHQV
ncbi:hypothetical protein BOX15_Mlig012253g1 [Macrostomum lignano]|uniref:EGF-like domain-containing protein n=1 Tax=Macrostomum lignano TaxID=282301 RepID=A0A267FCN7_9PLAT|nr:hypothetical protein BOX15_Mlig012253g1 [Macrostomum lignano]